MSARHGVFVSCAATLWLLGAGASAAQFVSPVQPRAAAGDQSAHFQREEAAQQALQRVRNGALGFPELPPVTASSPRNLMEYESRRFVNQEAFSVGDSAPTLVQVIIPAGAGGTGTTIPELLWYQLPVDYVPGDPRPMVIAWHGYGSSANSVQLQSAINEEANARGWIYLAPTGLDDKIFGTPAGQQHARVAIDYMTSNFSVDEDRLYMVGFSMGAGVVANFASRHRDPDGIMIAAVGLVSPSLDWAQTYDLGSFALKLIMQNNFNFGGTVTAQLFRYQQASTLHHALLSYPPAPGTPDDVISMGDNLDTLPVYITWDTGDPLAENTPAMGANLAALITSVGGSVETHPVSGTVDPITLNPAPHSWAVLNEVELFDFFAPHTVDRTPETFRAQLDVNRAVAFVAPTQSVTDSFSFVDGSSADDTLSIENVTNIERVSVDVGVAGLSGVWPLRVIASSADAAGFTLRLTGFDQPPSYLLTTAGSTLVTGVDSDPATGSLIVDVPGNTTLDVQVISEPWTASLTTTPNPVPYGDVIQLDMDGTAGTSVTSLLIVSLSELLTPLGGGYKITAALVPPAFLLQIPLDVNGDFSLPGAIPNAPVLAGMRFPLQSVNLNAVGGVDSISNLWGLSVQ